MTEPKVLWQQLQQAGLVTEAQPPLADRNPQPAFFLRMLLGVCGWLSALFFCGFISAVFVSFLSNSQNIWGLGIILCVVSVWISRLDNIPLFLEQFVFACSLTGQAFIVFGVWESSGSNPVTATCMLALELMLFVSMGIRSQRATAVFLAVAALLWLLGQHAWLYALPVLSTTVAWLWLRRLSIYTNSAYLQPASIGLTLALWAMIFVALLGNSTELQWLAIAEDNWHSQLWIAAALTSLLCLFFAWQLIQRRVLQPKLAAIALLISIGIGLVNLKMPGLAPLCLLLCIGVALAHTRLIWLNLFLLGVYLLLYYYSLNNSLLYKSVLLCLSGAVLLMLYALLNHSAHLVHTEQKNHA